MIKSILLFMAVLGTALAFAQAPNKMSYQSVMRDASGSLLSGQAIAVKISILQSSASGTVVYSERHTLNTNANGLATLQIGDGTVLSGSFTSINWGSGTYFVKTETDPNGGTSYTVSGTQQLLSVPYALNAKTADALTGGSLWTTSGSNIYNANSGFVGIGTSTPDAPLTIGQPGATNVDYALTADKRICVVDGPGSQHAAIFSLRNNCTFIESYDYSVAEYRNVALAANGGNVGVGSLGFSNVQLDVTGTDDYGLYVDNPSASQFALYVNGSAAKPGGSSWTVASDARLKQDVVTYSDGLSLLMSIKPVKFRYTKESGFNPTNEYVGVLAQDLQEVAPYMVESFNNRNDGKDYLAVDNHAMTYMLINAVQEQQEIINELQLQLLAMKKLLEEVQESTTK